MSSTNVNQDTVTVAGRSRASVSALAVLLILSAVGPGSTVTLSRIELMAKEQKGIEFLVVPGELLRCRDVNPTDKLVYAYVKLRQGKNAFTWVSVSTIAEGVGVSINTARTSTKRLEELGLIRARRTSGGNTRTNHYCVVQGGLEALLKAPHVELTRCQNEKTLQVLEC